MVKLFIKTIYSFTVWQIHCVPILTWLKKPSAGVKEGVKNDNTIIDPSLEFYCNLKIPTLNELYHILRTIIQGKQISGLAVFNNNFSHFMLNKMTK